MLGRAPLAWNRTLHGPLHACSVSSSRPPKRHATSNNVESLVAPYCMDRDKECSCTISTPSESYLVPRT
jgi:hypothetical protein